MLMCYVQVRRPYSLFHSASLRSFASPVDSYGGWRDPSFLWLCCGYALVMLWLCCGYAVVVLWLGAEPPVGL